VNNSNASQKSWDSGNKRLEKEVVLKRNSWRNMLQLIRFICKCLVAGLHEKSTLERQSLSEVKMGRDSATCKKLSANCGSISDDVKLFVVYGT